MCEIKENKGLFMEEDSFEDDDILEELLYPIDLETGDIDYDTEIQ